METVPLEDFYLNDIINFEHSKSHKKIRGIQMTINLASKTQVIEEYKRSETFYLA